MSWFESLEERERVFVITAAVFVVVAAFWFGIWTPLDSGQRSVSARVETWQLSLAELQPLKGQIEANGASQPMQPNPNQSLIVIIDNTLRQRGLYESLQRSQPTPAGNGIRVEFSNVAFDEMMLWLGDLNRQFGMRVQSGNFSIATGDSPGRVNSTLTLER
jgi:general secretion pathway protein M